MIRKNNDRRGGDESLRRGLPSPSPRLRGEGRGEGASPQAQPLSSGLGRGPLTRNLRDKRANSDLSPQAGRGEDRIAKVMARAGLCSRRQAEEWIAAGRVAVNGGTISSPAVNVNARDRITVDGKPLLRRERTRLFRYHKPAGLVSTNADPQGRPAVFDALPRNLPRLMSVGRLDIGTEGLLLLTNDGGLARVLELPDTGWVRRYRVRAHGRVSQADLDRLRDGITIDGIHYGPIEATLEREQGTNVWLSFAIREGKNREVRNVLAHLGLAVNRLIRTGFGPFGLGSLAEGAIEEVATGDLREQLGERIIARAGCDFSSPIAAVPFPNPPPRAGKGRGAAGDEGKGGDLSREERRELRRMLRDRDRQPEGRRSEQSAARRDGDDRRERPPGRPRRGHAWRQDDAPLRRTYRGSRRDDLKIADEARPDKRAGLVTDPKGRRIFVERFGTKKDKPQAAETPARGRPRHRRPPPDRASGPRPSRPRFSDHRPVETPSPQSKSAVAAIGGPKPPPPYPSPRAAEDREGARPGRNRGAGSRRRARVAPPSPTPNPSPQGGGEARKSGFRSEGPRTGRPGKSRLHPPGPRTPRPRPSGPRRPPRAR
jgi:23S rRNA pseudouridine2605 synthase